MWRSERLSGSKVSFAGSRAACDDEESSLDDLRTAILGSVLNRSSGDIDKMSDVNCNWKMD